MPMPTVAIDVPSAQVLADQASIISELQFVMDSCKRLLTDLAQPEEVRDPLMPLALWMFKGCPVCWTVGLFETAAHAILRRAEH